MTGILGEWKEFYKTMLNDVKNHIALTVVYDQTGLLTYTYDLAHLLVDMLEIDKYGYYHAANEGGYISCYDLINEIFCQIVEQENEDFSKEHEIVMVVSTKEYRVFKVKRPFHSRLNESRFVRNGFERLLAY